MPTSTQRTVKTPQGEIIYTLTIKPVKNINLRIKPDGEVCVSASPRAPKALIDGFVESKAEMIFAAITRCSARKKPPQSYADGAEIFIFGKAAVIHTVPRGKSFYSDGVLTLAAPDKPDLCRAAYEKWESDFCARLFRELTDRVHALYARQDIPNPVITAREMSSRWGSCRPNLGKITLNKKLLHVPTECTVYVIAHELAHFVQPNHSARFYAVVGGIIPDYKARKRLLEDFAAKYLD